MYDNNLDRQARPLDRSRITEHESTMMAGIVTVSLFAAALILALAFLVWPRGTTTTGTAVTENLPKIEQPAPITPPVQQ